MEEYRDREKGTLFQTRRNFKVQDDPGVRGERYSFLL